MPLFLYSTFACPMLPSVPLFGYLSRQRFTVHTDVPVRICVLVPDLAPASVHATVSDPFSVHITLYDSVPVPALVYVIANASLQIFVPTYVSVQASVFILFLAVPLSFVCSFSSASHFKELAPLFLPLAVTLPCSVLRSSTKYSCCVPYPRTLFFLSFGPQGCT